MTSTEADVVAGRYRLDDRIGVGAMGEVWRARDLTLQRDVAVKRVRFDGHLDAAAQARFQREAVAMAGVSHPNVVSVYDAGTDEMEGRETAYLVMELLEGPSCSAIIASERVLDFAEIARIGAGVARGLAAAHAAGVVHRDIKPGNVVVSRGVPTIVDFGIARLEQESTATLTAPHTAIGTAAYMSPEQAMGKHVGPASDVYSLGALLFALATGSPPFGSSNALALMRAHVDDTPPLLSSVRDDAPPQVVDLVRRMLVKEPAGRPTAPEVAAVLEGVLGDAEGGSVTKTSVLPEVAAGSSGGVAAGRASDRTTEVVPAPVATRVPSPGVDGAVRPRRRSGLLMGVLAAAAVALAMLAFNVWGLPGSQTAQEDPTTQAETASTPDEPTSPDPGPTERIVSPEPTTNPAVTQQPVDPGGTQDPAGATLEEAVTDAEATLSAVADPEARDDLLREWQGASSGLQGANAEEHLRGVIEEAEDLADDGQVSPDELAAIRSAIEQVIARLP